MRSDKGDCFLVLDVEAAGESGYDVSRQTITHIVFATQIIFLDLSGKRR